MGPSYLDIFFFFTLFHGSYHMAFFYFFIFRNRDICRNQHILWRVHKTSDYVIFTSKVPSYQVAIYWVLRGQIFLSVKTSSRKIKSSTCFWNSLVRYFQRANKNYQVWKNVLGLIRSVTTGPKYQVAYSEYF